VSSETPSPSRTELVEEKIQTTNLVTQVTERLRRQILTGQLAPHSQLPPESQMCEMFGVSRTVIREAMRHLRAQDLVEVARGRRSSVKPVDPQAAIETIGALIQRSEGSLAHLQEVRRALESDVAELAAARATDQQIAAMTEANEALRTAVTIEDRIRNDWRFHERLAEASNNPILVLFLKTIAGLFQESLLRTSHSDAEVVYEGHARVIRAVERRDPSLARSVVLDNLRKTELDLEKR